MSSRTDRRVILAARPVGVPGPEVFRVEEGPAPTPGEGEFLVRNSFLSVDPAMRGWVNDGPNYSPPVPVGDVMRSFAVGEVIESRNAAYPEGAHVTGMFGWRRYAVSDGSGPVLRVEPGAQSPSRFLGVLGLNGITAYFGLVEACAPKAGETVIVSTAAGAVGATVGQIAKALGCRTVGIAGGPEKTRLCREAFGYDHAIDYKAERDMQGALAAACPDGVDIYFDNTCGAISDAVMTRLSVGARILICGTAAEQNWIPIPQGPRVHRQILTARARMQGFLAFDHYHRADEAVTQLSAWLASGAVTYREHILDGLDAAPGAIAMLYRGENHGKLLIRVD